MVALHALLTLTLTFGQASSRPAQSAAELADPYVDGSYGISIQPPKGWNLVRQQVPEAKGVTLLRMVDRVAANRVQEMILKRTSTTKSLPIAEMLDRVGNALELEFSEVKIVSQQAQEIAGKPGAVLAATFLSEGLKQLRLEGLIEIRPQQYLVLLYTGPVELRDRSEPLFHAVLGSIKLLGDEMSEADLAAASEAAVKWMSRLAPGDIEKAATPEQYLEVRVDGELIGVVYIQQVATTWKGYRGVRIRERGWTFERDGRTRRLQSTIFVSGDLQHERWKTSVTTLLPAEGDQPQKLDNSWEEGLRDGEALLTNQTYRINEPAQENPALQLPKTYIPRALVRLLPRLTGDLSKPGKLAFTAFDHQKAGLVLRVVELKGQCDPPEGAARGKAFCIEDREGFAEPSTLYVDESGKLLMMKAGKLVMQPGARAELEKRFADRIDQADDTMARLEKQYQAAEQRFMRPRPAEKKENQSVNPPPKQPAKPPARGAPAAP